MVDKEQMMDFLNQLADGVFIPQDHKKKPSTYIEKGHVKLSIENGCIFLDVVTNSGLRIETKEITPQLFAGLLNKEISLSSIVGMETY